MTTAEKNRSFFVDNFKMQLSEVELMQSMYPNENEFVMDDPSAIADITDYVDGKTDTFPASRLEYIVNIHTDKATFELSCAFPPSYPDTEPEIYIRSEKMTRVQQSRLNEDASNLLNRTGNFCIIAVLQWLQEHANSYIDKNVEESAESLTGSGSVEEKEHFTRYWIYSHHIYNKVKRKTILKVAKEPNLTGFCLPGKPGIICVEGRSIECSDFWGRIKHMNWKKIICKKIEIEDISDQGIDVLRKFSGFSEVEFEARMGQGREFHMNLGAFLCYLDQHECGYIFKDYFGVHGKFSQH